MSKKLSKIKPLYSLILLIVVCFLSLFSCKKEEKVSCITEPIPTWVRFVGDYKVYDTTGVFLYNMKISHFSGINSYGSEIDSFFIENFIDTFDFKVHYSLNLNLNFFDYGGHDSIPDKNGNHWFLDAFFNDSSTPVEENTLINDTIIFKYRLTNIKYYLSESVPYYYCDCKQIGVKQ
jgi:hypothetical protein